MMGGGPIHYRDSDLSEWGARYLLRQSKILKSKNENSALLSG
jgi:hypothetical protein